jgi:hypothetical protein
LREYGISVWHISSLWNGRNKVIQVVVIVPKQNSHPSMNTNDLFLIKPCVVACGPVSVGCTPQLLQVGCKKGAVHVGKQSLTHHLPPKPGH